VRRLVLIAILGTVGALPASADALKPGSEEWRGLFDPPYSVPTEVPADLPLRKQLFDLLRPKVERIAKKPVRFEGGLRAFKNWAIFLGRTVDENGRSMKLPPMGNDDAGALWLRTSSGWVLVDFAVGASDAFHLYWPDQYGVPKALVGFEEER